MAGSRVEKHPVGGPGDTHDYDLFAVNDDVQARVECVELTSETAENWGSEHDSGQGGTRRRGREARPRRRPATSPRFRWEARLSIRNPSADSWQPLHDDPKGTRKERRRSIDDWLISRALWAESQMGTAKGAANLANDRHGDPSDSWDEQDSEAGVSPYFSAEEPASDGQGSLRVVFDGSSSGWGAPADGDRSHAAERIGEAVAEKSDNNQAGAHPEPKWLLISLSLLWAPAVVGEIEQRTADPPALAAFASEVDMGRFSEVWIVWETAQSGKRPGQATSVLVLSADGPPRHLVVPPN